MPGNKGLVVERRLESTDKVADMQKFEELFAPCVAMLHIYYTYPVCFRIDQYLGLAIAAELCEEVGRG